MERRRKAIEKERLRETAEQKAMEQEEAYQREVDAYWTALWAEEELNRMEAQRRAEMELYLQFVVEYALGELRPVTSSLLTLVA